MTGNELIIIFKKDKAYLTLNKPLNFTQLELPAIAKSFKSSAFWTLKVLKHFEDQNKIHCEILNYQIGEPEFSEEQIAYTESLSKINTITFRSIDTDGLLGTLHGSAPTIILPRRYVEVDRTIQSESQLNYTAFDKASQNKVPALKSKKTALTKHSINEVFFVPIKKIRFKLGGVSFDKKFEGYNKTLEINITNYEIREEFDAVKNYFANVLKTRKIQVTVHIEIDNDEINIVSALSPEIDRIDKQIIEKVKIEFVKGTIKNNSSSDIDKSLFTMDEYFDTFADKRFKSNTFHNDEKELFEDIISITNTKHYKNLRFLSSKHSHEIMKLRFVHKPFSFIFLIQGERNYHIIWETLDTEEATYVWHIAKNIPALKLTLKKIEDIINVIKAQGKIAYISTTDDPFRRIYHDYSELVDGFVKWKRELENTLT